MSCQSSERVVWTMKAACQALKPATFRKKILNFCLRNFSSEILNKLSMSSFSQHELCSGFSPSRLFFFKQNIIIARRLSQSILKEINPEYSLEGLMPKLKLQYFGHLIRGADSLEKTLMLGKIEGGRRRGRQGMRWLDGITDSMDKFE